MFQPETIIESANTSRRSYSSRHKPGFHYVFWLDVFPFTEFWLIINANQLKVKRKPKLKMTKVKFQHFQNLQHYEKWIGRRCKFFDNIQFNWPKSWLRIEWPIKIVIFSIIEAMLKRRITRIREVLAQRKGKGIFGLSPSESVRPRDKYCTVRFVQHSMIRKTSSIKLKNISKKLWLLGK